MTIFTDSRKSRKANEKAARYQEQAANQQAQMIKEQAKQQALAVSRSRRAGIREEQIARSRAKANSQAMGAGAGSSAQGGAFASLSSQLGSNLGFSTQMSGLSENITNFDVARVGFLNQANRSSTRAANYAAKSQLGMQVLSIVSSAASAAAGGGGA